MRTNHHLLIVLAAAFVGVSVFSSQSATASWAAVALEILADEADVIIVGKVTKIQDGGFAVGQRKFDVAVVKVSRILKSKPQVGKPKQLRIGQPSRGRIGLSTDIRFRPGQEGIWLLKKDPDRNVYWARHPSQFQPIKQLKLLTDLVKARQKLAGGKPVDGLTLRAELSIHKGGNGPTYFQIRISLKNVSDKPVTVCNYVGNQPLQVAWTGPDGKPRKSSHYAWLALVRLRGVSKKEFTTLQPGDVMFLGPRSKQSGIFFQPGAKRANARASVNVPETGKHAVVVSFKNVEAGKRFGLKGVWTGVVSANAVTFTVK